MRAALTWTFLSLCLLGGVASATAQEAPTAAAPKVELVEFSSPASHKRLARSSANADFFVLANQFEAQMNIGTCGPTSAVIVLNALRPTDDKRRPIDRSAFPEERWEKLPEGFSPVKGRYTQRAFLDEHFTEVKSVGRFYGEKDADGQRDPGLQLRELHRILKRHGLESKIQIVSEDVPSETIKAEMIANLKRPDDFIIVNYHRNALNQPGGGHISPVAAYDEASDSFLVMDVNVNKAPWVWVASDDLIRAMRTPDKSENRGYLLVREGKQQTAR